VPSVPGAVPINAYKCWCIAAVPPASLQVGWGTAPYDGCDVVAGHVRPRIYKIAGMAAAAPWFNQPPKDYRSRLHDGFDLT